MKQKPMEIINVRTASQPAFDPEDVDIFVRVVNGEELPQNLQMVPQWEREFQQRVDTVCHWFKFALTSTAILVMLGFSVIGVITTVAHFVAG